MHTPHLPLPLARVSPAALAAGGPALLFQGFSILPDERRVLVVGETVKMGGRAFDLLMTLVVARDRVVGKDELLECVWPGLVVEENNLQVHVSQLRKLLGSRVIATVPGRGYQFTAPSVEAAAVAARADKREVSGRLYTGATPGGNLPAALPPLYGRETELAEVVALLRQERWVTITGAGGMGKTRLAESAGHALVADCLVWLVELAAVSDPGYVPNAVAQALGATIIDSERPIQALVDALQGPATLLILDNCEHLLAAVANLGDELLRALPNLRLLVTSQELLRGSDERVYKLGPLALPAKRDLAGVRQAGAVRLLVARVGALSRQFEIDENNLDDAAQVCEQLDGLPLAIELAAARVPMLGLTGVRARLGERFRLLTGDARVRLRRHQTLRAALDWSYQLLTPDEQALLRRLGTFAGSFSVEGVRQLAGDGQVDEWTVLDMLGSLIDKSLVQVRGLHQPRYLLLETTRAYALEQLAANDETAEALEGHARATREVCRLAAQRRDTQAIWDEIANIRAAFRWAMSSGDPELSIALTNETSVVLALGGLVGEVLQRLVEVEPLVNDALPLPLAAQYWQWLGRFGHDGRLPSHRCVAALGKAEALFRQLHNPRHVHACLRMRAEALIDLGDLAAARQAIASARELEGDGPALADRMRRLRIEGRILDAGDDIAGALQRLEQALDLARGADIHRYVATLTQDIGQVLLHASKAEAAQVRFCAVLEDLRPDLSVALAEAYARMGLAVAQLMQGQIDAARATALQAVPPLQSCGILLAHAEDFAWLLAALGQPALAWAMLETADSFRSFSRTVRGPVAALAYLRAAEILGDTVDLAPDKSQTVGSDTELARLLIAALSTGLATGA